MYLLDIPIDPGSCKLKEVPGRLFYEDSLVSWAKCVIFNVFGITEGFWQVKKKNWLWSRGLSDKPSDKLGDIRSLSPLLLLTEKDSRLGFNTVFRGTS